jgi:hypothetical protein
MSLDFLFGAEARMAWAANAVKVCAKESGREMKQILANFKSVTVPKAKKARIELVRSRNDSLDFRELIAKANAIVETKWSDVIAMFAAKMLEE